MKKILMLVLIMQCFTSYSDGLGIFFSVTDNFDKADVTTLEKIFADEKARLMLWMEMAEKTLGLDELNEFTNIYFGLLVATRYIILNKGLALSESRAKEMVQLSETFKSVLDKYYQNINKNINISREIECSYRDRKEDYLKNQDRNQYRNNVRQEAKTL